MRNLILIFGDQLSHRLSSFDDFDRGLDRVWMAEVDEEATKVWCHKSRLVFFFSAMRHFRDELRERDIEVDYHELSEDGRRDSGRDFSSVLKASVRRLKPERLVMTEPGDWFVRQSIESTARELDIALEVRTDRHFYCSIADFAAWAEGRKSLILENFYRWMRKQHRVLIDKHGKPVGGAWNFDKENRQTFKKSGPGKLPPLPKFKPSKTTRQVMAMVAERYSEHPGDLDDFDYPVTAEQAQSALQHFIEHRLPQFGDYQDAMWTDTELLYHSRLSAVMNAHLLDPFDVVHAAIDAYDAGDASINSVEGFVRQVLGWREFVRGVYWTLMPEYIERNALEAERDVPQAYWDGETEMNCIRQAMQDVIKHAYAHHIQRLMVLGLYAQLLGVHPRKFHDWHMAMYADAIDWVSLPNTLGMSQHADGGVVGTKPYCASGNYIDRMSNYCKSCRFNPKLAVGEDACPVTTMYWDFLHRHQEKLRANGRMTFQIKNLDNKDPQELKAILKQAAALKAEK
jgi:deoxyribodipyrimidine photolyase-related protein